MKTKIIKIENISYQYWSGVVLTREQMIHCKITHPGSKALSSITVVG